MSGTQRVHLGWNAWRIGLLLCATIWWGGLSFYAMIVVPIGSDLIGSSQQGAITQRVTQWHNGISCLLVVLVAIEAVRRRSLALTVCGALLAVTTIGLIIWHHRLSLLLLQAIPDHQVFYQEHAVYLWMTTFEWGVGLFSMCLLFTIPEIRDTGRNVATQK